MPVPCALDAVTLALVRETSDSDETDKTDRTDKSDSVDVHEKDRFVAARSLLVPHSSHSQVI